MRDSEESGAYRFLEVEGHVGLPKAAVYLGAIPVELAFVDLMPSADRHGEGSVLEFDTYGSRNQLSRLSAVTVHTGAYVDDQPFACSRPTRRQSPPAQ